MVETKFPSSDSNEKKKQSPHITQTKQISKKQDILYDISFIVCHCFSLFFAIFHFCSVFSVSSLCDFCCLSLHAGRHPSFSAARGASWTHWLWGSCGLTASIGSTGVSPTLKQTVNFKVFGHVRTLENQSWHALTMAKLESDCRHTLVRFCTY